MSPKNKGTFGKGKSTVEVEDDFISGVNRLAERLRPYALRLSLFGGALVLALLGLAIHSWYQGRRAAKATSAFSGVLHIVESKVEAPSDKGSKTKGAKGAKATENKADQATAADEAGQNSYPSAAARDKAALAAIHSLRSKYGSSGVGTESGLLKAAVLLDLGKYDKAAAAYQAYADSDVPAYLRAMAREGVGYAFEEKALAAKDPKAKKAGLDKALKSFEQMQPSAKGPMYAYALYHQARVLGELDRRKEAIARFKKALKATQEQGLSSDINDRLAVLESAPSK